MRKNVASWMVVSVVAAGLCVLGSAPVSAVDMGFFVTSAGSGKGADLGASKGRTRSVRRWPKPAGAGGKTWRAYLSTQGPGRRERPRPDRDRSLGQRQGGRHREESGRAARRRTTSPSRRRLPRRARSSTAAATRRTCTTSSPGRSPTVRRSATRPTGPAPTGPAAA